MYYGFRNYVSVAQKQVQAETMVKKLRGEGRDLRPVAAFKGKLAATFWGTSWCANLESYADFENRLGRGRSYARCGAVCDLRIEAGMVRALVNGSSLYTVSVGIQALEQERWRAACERCAGQVGSLLELLQGKFSRQVMEIMCDKTAGIFPSPAEMSFSCSCPDWAGMCKHVAAALYGVGRRLDTEPELLFLLRGVNAADLIPASLDFSQHAGKDSLQGEDLGTLFGIDLADEPFPPSGAIQASAAQDASGKAPSLKSPAAKAPFKAERPTAYAVRRLRKLTGLSPTDFAGALGVRTATLCRWEESKGVLTLRPASVAALSRLQEEFFGKDGERE